jgi:hypothetical protein
MTLSADETSLAWSQISLPAYGQLARKAQTDFGPGYSASDSHFTLNVHGYSIQGLEMRVGT